MTAHHAKNRLFQTSTMAALLDAVYDGDLTIKELLTHGDFGLGTFNALDGEMIVDEGIAHQFRAGGLASDVPENLKTPFACVTWFEAEKTVPIKGPCTREELEEQINTLIDNPNLFAAIRFTGHFETVETRTVYCQNHPYPPMLEVVAKQPTFTMNDMDGVMLGFRTPPYMQGINVAGFHVHFLSKNQKHGGHVTEYRLGDGKLEVARISQLDLTLPLTKEFAEADLMPPDLAESIRTAEGS